MSDMGGLRKRMPITHAVMFVGVLAIIGFPGLAGFFSKDEILWKAWIGGGPIIWGMAALAAVCTAFYMVRLLMLTFYGDYRGNNNHGHDSHGHGGHGHHEPHETSAVMWAPLIVLALLSIFVGYLNIPHVFPVPMTGLFSHYLEPVVIIPKAAAEHWAFLEGEYSHALEYSLMGMSILGMLVGSLAAISLYKNGYSPTAIAIKQRFAKTYETLLNKYWVDEFYDRYFVQSLRDMSEFLWRIIDVLIIDGIVNGVGQACALIGGLASFNMSGSLHRHAMVIVLGLFCLLSVLIF
jgi:NADH-quinone oxidoreductase subunit L